MDWRRLLAGVGRALIAGGVLLLLFVAYQLWGTGIHEARSQNQLRDAFEDSIATVTSTPTTATTVPPRPVEGDAVALLRIPSIDVDKAVIEGVSVADLKKGPGHYPTTPMPGQPGNASIAGHRTTYGAPFYRLDELEMGDEILVTTLQGDFRYEVDGITVVQPNQTEVLDPTEESRLTLTTCEPRFSARERLVVSAVLAGKPAAAPPATGPTPSTPSFDPAGLSGDPEARWPAALWGALAAAVALVTWLAGRRWKRLPAYVLGAPVFLVVLFMFYENVARLLPANI